MKNIGMIVAVQGEIRALLEGYGEACETVKIGAMTLRVYSGDGYKLHVMQTGAGEIAAAAGTQYLISVCGADMILDYGIVGGLTDDMASFRTVIAEKVVHYDFDTSEIDGTKVGQYMEYPDEFIPLNRDFIEKALAVEPSLKPVTVASGDKFVADAAKKRELFETFGAEICEMEAAAVALTCDRNGVPCLMIKTVADSITGGAEGYWETVKESAGIAFRITDRIIREL